MGLLDKGSRPVRCPMSVFTFATVSFYLCHCPRGHFLCFCRFLLRIPDLRDGQVGLVSQGRGDLDPNSTAYEEIAQGQDVIKVSDGTGFAAPSS